MTRIVPSSAAIAEQARAVTMSAANTGAISRVSDSPTVAPTSVSMLKSA